MKQRIYLTLCLIALVSLFCSTIASLSLYMSFHNQDKQEDLQSHCNDLAVAAAEIERLGGDVLGFLQDAADPSVRITLIRPDGFVVWDSKADSSRMENHSDRPEVRQAMDQRMGQDNRRSLTIDLVISTGIQSADLIKLTAFGGQYHDRNVGKWGATDPLRNFHAIHIRQHDIQKQQLRRVLVCRCKEIGAARDAHGLIAAVFQSIKHQLTNTVVVFNDVNSIHVCDLLSERKISTYIVYLYF